MAIYSFTTLPLIPTSEWDCADFYDSVMDSILLFPDVTISRGTPWIGVNTGTHRLEMISDDGVVSSFQFEVPFQQQFSFETQFQPVHLPQDLSQLTQSHLFIGAFDKQDNAAGLLISKMGLAIVSSYGSSVLPIPGSHTIFDDESVDYTLRMLVDGLNNQALIYITKTADLPTTGHQLRYTAPAPTTPLTELDSFVFNLVGSSAFPVEAHFASMRAACTTLLYPNQRPIADPGPDQTANLGSVVRYDGSESYDPEGNVLTYSWQLTNAPDTSRFSTIGTDGYGYDDGGPDLWTTIFYAGTDVFNETNSPNLQPGDQLIFGGEIYTVSTVGWSLLPSGKYERDIGGTWPVNSDRIYITEDVLPKNGTPASWKVCHTKSYFSDDTYVMPTAVPDVPGIYELRLIVNDGHLDSLPQDEMLNVSAIRITLGCTPDLSWIWLYLSDFWKLVDDRAAIDSIWSGFAQAAAAQLLTAWQIDYNKSLVDIQRKFQRRWLDYDTVLNEADSTLATISIVRGTIYKDITSLTPSSLDDKVLQLVLDASAIQEVKFGWSQDALGNLVSDPVTTLSDIARQINYWMGYERATTKLADTVVVGGTTYLSLDYPTLLLVRPNSDSNSANTLLGFSVTAYTQNDLSGLGKPYPGGDPTQPIKYYGWQNTSPTAIDFTTLGLSKQDLLVVDEIGYALVKVATGSILTLNEGLPTDITSPDAVRGWGIPSVVESASIDFDEQLVFAGDIARFDVEEIASGMHLEITCEVLGVRAQRLGFDARPLLEHYAGVPSNYTTQFVGIKHVKAIPVHEYVLDIPQLQETIKDPQSVLTQNLDFFIDDGLGSNAIRLKAGLFSLADPPPDTFWAELTYLDNRPTIEANFGRLVNFKVEDLSTRTDDLDYLSAVRGLWWAYFGGPSLYRVRVGTQILLGLPFVESAGTVTEIETQFSATEGRILMQDTADPTITRSYFYPLQAGLGVVPETGETIKVGDTLTEFTPLSGGIEVEDWISSKEWFLNYVSTGRMLELDKFFKFLVRMDVDTFNLTNVSFAVDFIKKIKPHYTNPIVVLLKHLNPTEVDVSDTVSEVVRLSCWEHFDPLQPGAWRYDDVYGNGTFRHHWDATAYADKFLYDRNRLSPVMSVWAVLRVTMDGIHPWTYDSLWAFDDGGGVDRVPLSGPDSSPPAPYGPLWGPIHFDEIPPAGRYARSKNL
jgi:hypothetical protein